MNPIKNFFDKIEPAFSEGGKFAALHSLYDGFQTFLLTPSATGKRGVHIHDAIDSKRTMIVVVLALVPALLFGMYNVGYQHYLAIGAASSFWANFWYGFLAVLPKIVVSYVVGLGIEFAVAQVKREEIAEGFLVTGFLIPLIVPVETPLWMIAIATAFAVVFAKEVFGGTGYNIFNVALVTRAFLFFAYPAAMSGADVFVRTGDTFGLGKGAVVDGFSGATPLGQAMAEGSQALSFTSPVGQSYSTADFFWGLIPGSIGETSVAAILIGAIILLATGIASWKIMLSIFGGGFLTALMYNAIGTTAVMTISPVDHLFLGGFAFGAVFMATDPVTAARTETGKWIYGFLIGFFAISIRVLNPGYPEGVMLAILLMNTFAPLIDYFVVEQNVNRRKKRALSAVKVAR